MAHELDGSELPEIPDLSADIAVQTPSITYDGGIGREDDGVVLLGGAEDQGFGIDESTLTDDRELPQQRDVPGLDQLLLPDEFVRAEAQLAKQVKEPDAVDDVATAEDKNVEAETPKPQHHISFESATVQASAVSDEGELSRLDGRTVDRGEAKELVVDDLVVRPDLLHSNVPVGLLSRVADECRAQGIPTIDSKVGSVRALEVRAKVFGTRSLQFHDPEAVDGDKILNIDMRVAAAYLAPGDRTPLHVRAFLRNVSSAKPQEADGDDSTDAESLVPPDKAAAILKAIGQFSTQDSIEIGDEASSPDMLEVDDGRKFGDEDKPERHEYDEDLDDTDNPEDTRAPEENDGDDEDNEVSSNGTILNNASFSAFYEEHYDAVTSFLARHFGFSEPEAEDLAQTAFTNAWDKRGSFDGANPKGWITTIAANLAKNRYNADKRGPQQVTDESALDRAFRTAADADPLPEDKAITTLDSEHLMRLYREAGINNQQAQILLLKHGYGLLDKEVAAKLGVARGTVASGNHRAVRKLQKLLQSQRQ